MTNLDQLVMQMEFSGESRRTLATELVRLRRLEAECRRHQRRLPYQVQTALRAHAAEYDIEPTPPGSPGLPLEKAA